MLHNWDQKTGKCKDCGMGLGEFVLGGAKTKPNSFNPTDQLAQELEMKVVLEELAKPIPRFAQGTRVKWKHRVGTFAPQAQASIVIVWWRRLDWASKVDQLYLEENKGDLAFLDSPDCLLAVLQKDKDLLFTLGQEEMLELVGPGVIEDAVQ